MSGKIRQGSSSMGTILFNWDNKNLRQGSSSMGKVIYNIEGSVPLPLCALIATRSI